MRRLVGVVAALWAGAACAADKLEFAPPAAWVKVAAASKPRADAGAADTEILLTDEQIRFDPQSQDTYVRNVVQVRTPQGLAAMNNVGVTWNPDTDTIVVHQLHILRGDKVIDVLANQTFTVLRRETNLELAVLDGQLTAAVQPEGLEAGDIVDFSFTLKHHDPILQGHMETLAAVNAGLPIDRLRVRALWPKADPMRWRVTAGLPAPAVSKTPDGSEFLIDEASVQPFKAPTGAPARYNEVRQIEVTGFKSWGEISALMDPLYAKAAVLKPDSPLKAEAAKIAAAATDPKARAAAALKLVQDKVRYDFLGMNMGGYVPAAADLTWSRRFGDCKGKTVVLLALLKELGVEAEPALISMGHGDGLDERLPVLEVFDHVLVRATIGGKTYWLDPTRSGDRKLDDIAVPNFKWALPVRPANAALERLTVAPFDKPVIETRINIDATGGLDSPEPAHLEYISRGDVALYLRQSLANQTPANLDSALKAFWKALYDWIEVSHVSAAYDEATGEEKLVMDGAAKIVWTKLTDGVVQYQLNGSTLGKKDDLSREPGMDAKAPFAVAYPFYSLNVETIALPGAGLGFEVTGDDIDKTVGGVAYRRTTRIDKGVMTMHASQHALAPEFPAGDAPAVSKALRAMWDTDVYLKIRRAQLTPTAADTEKALASNPTNAGAFEIRAQFFAYKHDFAHAMADYDKAIALDPKRSGSFSGRGVVKASEGDLDDALKDFDTALTLNAKNVDALRGRAQVALARNNYSEALVGFDAAIAIYPDDPLSLRGRGEARHELHDDDGALADLAESTRIRPELIDAYLESANIYASRDHTDLAMADLDRMMKLNPQAEEAHAGRADFLAHHGHKEEAVKEYAAAIALKPTASVYLARAMARPGMERTERLADVDLALKLDPGVAATAHQVRASIFMDDKDFAAAADEYAEAQRLDPADQAIPRRRLQALNDAGKHAEAYAQLDKMIAAEPRDSTLLNERCWLKGTAGMDLPNALADCDAALKLKPDSWATMDSRGMVDLKLGKFEQAIADYDGALKGSPNLADSLFGRGIAELRLGKSQAGQADLAAAKAADPKIAATFAGYGLKP